MHQTPIYTFWAIISMTLVALLLVHLLKMDGDQAMPVFVVCMLLGVPLGEVLERRARRQSKSP